MDGRPEGEKLSELEKAGIEAAVRRCNALASRIEEKLRNSDLQDVRMLAELHASLENAASLLKIRDKL
jgi:hypothetical protein